MREGGSYRDMAAFAQQREEDLGRKFEHEEVRKPSSRAPKESTDMDVLADLEDQLNKRAVETNTFLVLQRIAPHLKSWVERGFWNFFTDTERKTIPQKEADNLLRRVFSEAQKKLETADSEFSKALVDFVTLRLAVERRADFEVYPSDEEKEVIEKILGQPLGEDKEERFNQLQEAQSKIVNHLTELTKGAVNSSMNENFAKFRGGRQNTMDAEEKTVRYYRQ